MTHNKHPYRFIAPQFVHLLAQRPEIERLVIDCRYRYARIALLLVEAVELLEEGYFSARGGLDGVEALQACLEAKCLCLCVSWRVRQCLEATRAGGGNRTRTSVSVTKGIAQPNGGTILHMP